MDTRTRDAAHATASAPRWGWSALLVICLTLVPLVLPLIGALRATGAGGSEEVAPPPLARDGAAGRRDPAASEDAAEGKAS